MYKATNIEDRFFRRVIAKTRWPQGLTGTLAI